MSVITGRIVRTATAGGGAVIPVATVGQVVTSVTALRALVGSPTLPSVVLRELSGATPGQGGDVFFWDAAAGTDDGIARFNAGGLGTSGVGWQLVGHIALVVRSTTGDTGIRGTTGSRGLEWRSTSTNAITMVNVRPNGDPSALMTENAGFRAFMQDHDTNWQSIEFGMHWDGFAHLFESRGNGTYASNHVKGIRGQLAGSNCLHAIWRATGGGGVTVDWAFGSPAIDGDFSNAEGANPLLALWGGTGAAGSGRRFVSMVDTGLNARFGSPTGYQWWSSVGSSNTPGDGSGSQGTLALSIDGTGKLTIPLEATFATAPLLDSLTASQVVVTNTDKQLGSLAYDTAATASTIAERDGAGALTATQFKGANGPAPGITSTATALVVNAADNAFGTASAGLELTGPNVVFKETSGGFITLQQRSTDAIPLDMKLQGGAAKTGAATHKDGGAAYLKGGAPAAGGIGGPAFINDGDDNTLFWAQQNKLSFYGHALASQQSVTGALSTVADAPAKAVLTSIIAALVASGLVTDGTT